MVAPPPEMPPGPPMAGPPPPPPSTPPPDPGAPAAPPPADDGLPELTDEERNRRLVTTTAAIALVSIAAMIGTFLVTRASSGDDGGGVAPPVTEASTAAGAGSADVDAVVEEISRFVEQTRELTFQGPVDVNVLDDEAFLERSREDFQADLDENRDRLEDAAGFYQAVGLWPPEVDPVEALSEFYTSASLGYYDPETGQLVVRGGDVSPLLRVTLAHELTHALEDQNFELDRPELDDATDESGFAFNALVEGSASRVEDAYKATLTDDEQVAADAEESQIGADLDVSAIPAVAIVEEQFLYDSGSTFVQAVFDDGGNAGIDRAYEDPPTTSEQIMEPEHWLEGEEDPVTVDPPVADADVVDDATAGQFVLDLLTDFAPGGEPVPEWDGDHYVLWREGSEYCVRLAIDGDVDGYVQALSMWATELGGTVEADGDRAIAYNCA